MLRPLSRPMLRPLSRPDSQVPAAAAVALLAIGAMLAGCGIKGPLKLPPPAPAATAPAPAASPAAPATPSTTDTPASARQ